MTDPDDAALRDTLLRWVAGQGLAPGSRMPAERDLAGLLGVSRFAVNRTLQALVAEGLVRQESRKIRTWIGDQGRVGEGAVIVVGDFLDSAPPEAAALELIGLQELHHGVFAELHRRKLPVVSISFADFFARGVAEVAPRGVLVMPGGDRQKCRALLDAIDRLRVPTVVGDEELPAAEVARLRADVVMSDQASGAEALVRHLHARGRRRIRMLLHRTVGCPAPSRLPWIQARVAGMWRGCEAVGLPLLPPIEALCMPLDADTPEWCEDQVRLEMGSLVEVLRGADRPDALMLLSDGETFATGAACRRLGLVPGHDIDITGYDHCAHHARLASYRALEPGVPQASIDRGLPEVGAEMVRTLCERVAGRLPPVPERRLIPGRLVAPLPG